MIIVDVLIHFKDSNSENKSYSFETHIYESDAEKTALYYAKNHNGECTIFHNGVKIAEKQCTNWVIDDKITHIKAKEVNMWTIIKNFLVITALLGTFIFALVWDVVSINLHYWGVL